jgi:hypothetical protein
MTKLIVALSCFANSPKKKKMWEEEYEKNSGGIEFRHCYNMHYLKKMEAQHVGSSCILQVTMITQFMDLVGGTLFQKYNFLENNYEKHQQAYFPLSKLIPFRHYLRLTSQNLDL